MKKLFFSTLLLLSSLQLIAGDHVNIWDIWDQIVWCGPHGNKALVCHSGNGKKYQEICISINSLKRGHLTVESGVTRLHGEDYFGKCFSTPEKNQVSIYPCNAAIKRRVTVTTSEVISNSSSNYHGYNDYIHAETTAISSFPDNNSYDQYKYDYQSVPAKRDQYSELSDSQFTTLLNTDSLSFVLNSETYGTNYFVDWCIHQTIPNTTSITAAIAPNDIAYTGHSELVSKYELLCGDDEYNLSQVSSSNYERINQTLSYRGVTLPSYSHCIWRQRFIETKEGKRPNRSATVTFSSALEIDE